MVPRAVFEVAQQKLLEKEEEVEVRKLFDICSWDGVSLNAPSQRVGASAMTCGQKIAPIDIPTVLQYSHGAPIDIPMVLQ